MTTAEKAWAAGFFDGEGSVAAAIQHGYSQFALRIVSTHLDTLKKFQTWFGGTITPMKLQKFQNKRSYVWHVSGKKSRECAKTLLPFSQEKAEQLYLFTLIDALSPQEKRDLVPKLKELKKV